MFATATDSLATAWIVWLQRWMDRRHMHADGAFLLRGQRRQRAQILLDAEIELASSFIQHLLNGLAFFFMLLPVLVLAVLVAIPNALAGPALHEGITLLTARRTQLLGWGRWGPVFRVGFTVFLFRRCAE